VQLPTEQKPASLSVKDLAVLIPLFATSLAISWEVGTFIPFGGFVYFSLSEHLLNAMYALPIALVFSVVLGIGVVPVLLYKETKARHERPRQSWAKTFAKGLVAVVFIGLAGWAISTWEYSADQLVLLGALLLVIVVTRANEFWFRRSWSSPAMLSALAATSIVVAILMGVANSLVLVGLIRSGRVSPATIVSKNDTTEGFVLMTGERGLLIYFPDGNRVRFQKADELQKIEWQTKKL
jgi:hypothetical protein